MAGKNIMSLHIVHIWIILKKSKIYYNCVNHRLNTPLKMMLFGKKNCPGKLEYNRIKKDFYFIH
jgi:hypothetical protein